MLKKWGNLKNKPRIFITNIPAHQVDMEELRTCIKEYLSLTEDGLGTPNNWQSFLLHGILRDQVVMDWILERHNISVGTLAE
jgi:hypothetical protein